jgi:hypothetical protein
MEMEIKHQREDVEMDCNVGSSREDSDIPYVSQQQITRSASAFVGSEENMDHQRTNVRVFRSLNREGTFG